jgi:branched-chain amino acid transport system substrate-binding protein
LKAAADMDVAAPKADGRALHPVYLFQAKTPAESEQPWDVAKVIATTPLEDA